MSDAGGRSRFGQLIQLVRRPVPAFLLLLVPLPLIFLAVPAGGHPDRRGLALFIYLLLISPLLLPLGEAVSFQAYRNGRPFRMPALFFCVGCGLVTLLLWALIVGIRLLR